MEINSNINTFIGGMDLDSDISVLDKNKIRYAENIRLVTNTDGTNAVLQNIDHISKCYIDIPNQTIIGMTDIKYYYDKTNKEYDCVVVITKHLSSDMNSVYVVIDVLDEQIHIVTGSFGWNERLSLVHNKESINVNNLYIADGVHSIRVINLAKKWGTVKNKTLFDMFPEITFAPFKFIGITDGNLKACKVQYAYQLFNKYGNASTLSPLSSPISISDTIGNLNQNDVYGSDANNLTRKGVKLSTYFSNNDFDRFRVYRIVYEEVGQIPTVYIADEFNLAENQSQVEYTDFGSNYLSILTTDELNQLNIPFDFIAQTIESKDNRLFAANIKELTWDVEYDARTYRADKDGNVVLKSATESDIVFNINNIPNEIPQQHDCLNPSNMLMFGEDSFKYIYNKDGKIGGTGVNVSYDFTFVEVDLSSQETTENNPVYNFKLQVDQSETDQIYYLDLDGNIQKSITLDKPFIKNYADPWMCSNMLGYMRDEIYRFGIVFYNKKGMVTPVHWIGDIRIPCGHIEYGKIKLLFPFAVGQKQTNSEKYTELISYAIGVRFNVDNLPDDVVSYEIVRCPRDEENRTIIMLSILNGLVKPFSTNDTETKYNWTNIGSDKDLRPQPFINLSRKFNIGHATIHTESEGDEGAGSIPGDTIITLTDKQLYDTSNNCFELISPEICVDLSNSEQIIKDKHLCRMYGLYSMFIKEGSINGSYEQVSTSYRQGVMADKVYSMSNQLSDFKNDYIFGWNTTNGFYVITPEGYPEGISGVFKYYRLLKESFLIDVFDIQDVLAPLQLTDIIPFKDTRTHALVIGNNTYINTSVLTKDVWGRHGKNLIITTPSEFSKKVFYEHDGAAESSMMNCGAVYNIKLPSKMFNGVYSDRQQSIYISCNAYLKKESKEPIYCFGGDTYLCVLDYLNTTYTQTTNDYEDGSEDRVHTQCYIPFETSINLNMLSNEQYHNTVNTTLTDDNNELYNIGLNLIQTDPVVLSGYVQDKPQYQYNAIYSLMPNAISFITKNDYFEDNLHLYNRIIVSEPKTNLEVYDSWLNFKVANYLDVDGSHGAVTNIKSFGNKLYFFQDSAVGVASVNERALITDDNMAKLTLGTGGVLDRFDYISTTNGDSIINDYSIVSSDYQLYWYDYNNNSICILNNSVLELSKIKNVQSYLNTLFANKVNRSRPIGVFNKKYNEVWIKIFDKSLVFNESLNAFTSFNTHDFKFANKTSDQNILTVMDNLFYIHNDVLNYRNDHLPLICKLNIVVNDNFIYSKTFDNVSFYADFKKNVNNISNLTFNTKTLKSETISAKDIECREDTYRLAIPREINKYSNTSYAGRMRGKYLEEFYTFDCTNNKTFKIPYIKTTYRQSML